MSWSGLFGVSGLPVRRLVRTPDLLDRRNAASSCRFAEEPALSMGPKQSPSIKTARHSSTVRGSTSISGAPGIRNLPNRAAKPKLSKKASTAMLPGFGLFTAAPLIRTQLQRDRQGSAAKDTRSYHSLYKLHISRRVSMRPEPLNGRALVG